MKGLLLGVLILLSVQAKAQTQTSTGNTKKTGAKKAATTTKSTTAASGSKSTAGNSAKPLKPTADYPSDSLANKSMKAINFKYRDSVFKYRDLMLYYQQTAGPKDTMARHYQKIAMSFQKKHFELNKPAIAYNDSLIKLGRKAELEKKYNIKLH